MVGGIKMKDFEKPAGYAPWIDALHPRDVNATEAD